MKYQTHYYGYGADRVEYNNQILNTETGDIIDVEGMSETILDEKKLLLYASSKIERNIALTLLDMDNDNYKLITEMILDDILYPDISLMVKLLEYNPDGVFELYKMLDKIPVHCIAQVHPLLFVEELNKFYSILLDRVGEHFILTEYIRPKSFFYDSIMYIDKTNRKKLPDYIINEVTFVDNE